jgi:hypothetical protein
MDSDGDGITNGEELGDPCCLWTPTNPKPKGFRTTILSHPGDETESAAKSAPKCLTGGAAAAPTAAAAPSSGSRSGVSGNSSKWPLVGGLTGVFTVLALLIFPAYCWERRSSKRKNANGVGDSSPDTLPATPALPAVVEQAGEYGLREENKQAEEVTPPGASTAVLDAGSAEYNLPPSPVWIALGGAAPSVDYPTSASADQIAAMSSTIGSSDHRDLLSSNYVGPPPMD